MGVKTFNVMSLGKAGLINPEQLGCQDSIDIIKDESLKIQKSFVKIGWYLKHIRDNELYKELGYSSVWECATDQLGYSQSTASRFINICEKFSRDHNSPELDTKYADFDKSQMIEMLPMEQEQLDQVTPDMTVKEIRAMKEEKKAVKMRSAEEVEDDNIPGQTNLEEDFPEYMPEETEVYATSHKDNEACLTSEEDKEKIIDGEYREIRKSEPTEEIIVPKDELAEIKCMTVELQPELPELKNSEQRKEWLADYKAWGLWYRDEHIDVNYYKYDFADGSRLVVAEYPQRYGYWIDKRSDEHYFHLLEKSKKSYKKTYDEQYRHQTDSETYLVEFLKNLQRKDK